jgi:hypothetical protein
MMYSHFFKLLFSIIFAMEASSSNLSLVPYKYDLLPIGSISPQGWIRSQLELQANGLAGHLFDFYRYVNDSSWLGGAYEYSQLHEAAPYWYNGIVPLAYTLRDVRLVAQANDFLNYVLEHQADDGWLGPETTKATRGVWARCLLLQGMMVSSLGSQKLSLSSCVEPCHRRCSANREDCGGDATVRGLGE